MNSKKKITTVRVGHIWNNIYMEYESSGDRNKNLSIKEYFNEIKLYLSNLQKFDTWKIQLTFAVIFVSSKYVDETRVMYSKSNNI